MTVTDEKALYLADATSEQAQEMGLKPDEFERVKTLLGRTPNIVELGVFSAMWSEHCSYKSSKIHLKKFPTDGPQVIQGPGENAGVVDIGDGQAVIFKMESHNHPSFIEPYQGAATGVGGILRDVFTMGARPVALLNALRFGAMDHPKTKHLVNGVVAGIGGYGNCMGVPTVGGETEFHASYNGNILVNAMCVGLAETDKIFYSAAKGVGNPVVYVGSKTGRDGIHGATMASASFDDDSAVKRPTVQVGDPFTEKLLLEACLELMGSDAIIAIQDMGAAGLTSSSVEMGAKGGTGMRLDLDRVPMRERGMNPYELMLSESQERMLMILKPGREGAAKAVFDKWGLDFAVIGETTDTKRLELVWHGGPVGDMPLSALADEAPVYERPVGEPPAPPPLDETAIQAPNSLADALRTLMASPDLCSRRWIWEQYDWSVMADTVEGPGGDAAVLRVHGTTKALALTTDVTPRYCFADPHEGGKQAVAEAWRNLTAVGADPLAITDCLNFGNPEKPEIMAQIAGCVEGMAEACRALSFPVVSGNVSLYNETGDTSVSPTPAVGGVGLLPDLRTRTGLNFKVAGEIILLVGETKGHLGQSLFLREIDGQEAGPPPPVDLTAEKRNGDFIRSQIRAGALTACHDVSGGGLLVAVAEMALAGDVGAKLRLPGGLAPHAAAFGEDQARYVVSLARDRAEAFISAAAAAGVPVTEIGLTGGGQVAVGEDAIPLEALRAAHEGTLPKLMAATADYA